MWCVCPISQLIQSVAVALRYLTHLQKSINSATLSVRISLVKRLKLWTFISQNKVEEYIAIPIIVFNLWPFTQLSDIPISCFTRQLAFSLCRLSTLNNCRNIFRLSNIMALLYLEITLTKLLKSVCNYQPNVINIQKPNSCQSLLTQYLM